jgi:hypothetical protein
MHLREGIMVKKHRVLVDGQNLEEEDFAIEVAGSMGDLETDNLFSVESMKTRMKQKNQMIAQLQDQIRHTENNIREEVNQRVENARTADKQEMQLLKFSLEKANKQMQISQVQVI